jgi:hypothetical protein
MDPLHDEETQLVTTLSSLEGSTSRHIAELFGSSLEDRAAFNARLNKIREDLAALRAATRDLAILAEEQDTCVLIDNPSIHRVSSSLWHDPVQTRYYTACQCNACMAVHSWKLPSPSAV